MEISDIGTIKKQSGYITSNQDTNSDEKTENSKNNNITPVSNNVKFLFNRG